MARITVTAKVDGGTHLKYGKIKAGQQYTIDEEDFGAELFERPPGFESPHERADRERLEAGTGNQEPNTGGNEAVAGDQVPDPDGSLPQSPVPSTKSPKGGK